MKYKNSIIEISLVVLFIVITSFRFIGDSESSAKNNVSVSPSEINEIIKQDSVYKVRKMLIDTAKVSFMHYNKEIEDSVVERFVEVANFFGFIEDERIFNSCISQICCESRGYQFVKNNPNKVLRGLAGEVGMTQIMPKTAFYTLQKMRQSDVDTLKVLGFTRPEFVKEGNKYREHKKDIINWLTNTDNNILLWGYIMSQNYDNTKNFYHALHMYNAGIGGYKRWVESGKSSMDFRYVKKIKSIKKKLSVI